MIIIDKINDILNAVFGLVLSPFKLLGPTVGLIAISIVFSLLLLPAFKKVSPQHRIQQSKNRIRAHFLGVRLYKDDVVLSLVAIKNMFLENIRYLFFVMVPMVILFLPVSLFLIHMNAHFGYQSVNVNQPVVFKVVCQESVDLNDIKLCYPEGVVNDSPPVIIPSQNEINWRIVPKQAGLFTIDVKYQNQTEPKVLVCDEFNPISFKRSKGFFDTIFNPNEPGIQRPSFVQLITINYNEYYLNLGRIHLHWVVVVFLVSIIIAFVLKDALKINF